MTGLAGFDFEFLNRRFRNDVFNQPVNLAERYGVSIISARGQAAWRCIGVYHLSPPENRGRHNVFVEVLDENGVRTRAPVIKWSWYMDAPTQTLRLEKPGNEPAADIPIGVSSTITLRVEGDGIPSDSVGGIHSRHPDEGTDRWNSYGHHSYYAVFQKQAGTIGTPPVTPPPTGPDEPTPQPTLTLEQRVEANERAIAELTAWRRSMEGD